MLYSWLNSFIIVSSICETVNVFCVHVLFRNSFSQLVGEEFLKFFDFSGDSLDVALRRFVRHLTAASEPQDYDQLLSHFAQRYHSCNSDQYKSAGTICIMHYELLFVHSVLSHVMNVEFIFSVHF